MDPAVHRLVSAIHAAPLQCVLALTGGGTGAAALLLNVPGGSRTVIEAVIPYAEPSLCDFLGHRPEHFCSEETSRAMASRARERAAWLGPRAAVVGVGCTAGLATDRPKKGDHHFHIAVHGGRLVVTYSLTLIKGARGREEEEAVLDVVLLNALAESAGVAERLPLALLPNEVLEIATTPVTGLLIEFLTGKHHAVSQDTDGKMRTDLGPAALLSGSFNPIHEGHWELAKAAGRFLGAAVGFELSVVNVDKPPLSAEEIDSRCRQFLWQAPLWLTRAPTFAEKAAVFPGTTFVVGADTAVRIIDPKYYHSDVEQMAHALRSIRERGSRFLVGGRVDATGMFQGLEELKIPSEWQNLFTGIPEFRCDVSSTQLRVTS